MKKEVSREVYVLLHNIRSTHNVGSMFRTSDALGVTQIFLSGYTPTPLDAFGRPRKDVAKVALGAEQAISWQYVKNPKKIILDMKARGVRVISLEQAKNAVDYKKVKVLGSVLFIVGNEVSGVSKNLLALSDVVAEIPQMGDKESLNVSVAFGVGLFRMLNI